LNAFRVSGVNRAFGSIRDWDKPCSRDYRSRVVTLGNQTLQEFHETSSGGGAMIVDKHRTKESRPVALCSSWTAFEEVGIEIEPAKPDVKTVAAPASGEKSIAT